MVKIIFPYSVITAVLKEPEPLYNTPEKLNIYIDESGNPDNRTANSRCCIISLVCHEGDEKEKGRRQPASLLSNPSEPSIRVSDHPLREFSDI